MSGLFGAKTPQSTKTQPIGALNVQTSVYGSAVPLVYGRNRVPINLIHFKDFKAIPHTEQQQSGGKGAPKPPANTTYTYQVAYAAAIGEGQIQGVGTIWKNKEKHTLTSLGYTLFTGAPDQAAWSYLTSNYPDEAVPYANTAYLAHPSMQLGDSPSLPNINVEVTGLVPFNVAGGDYDAEPSDIITDYLTHSIHGAGLEGYLGDLTLYSSYCIARDLLLSPVESNQRPASQFLKEMAEVTNSALLWTNGKLTVIPYGDTAISANGETYTPDMTPLYDITVDDLCFEPGHDPIEHFRKPQTQAYNHIRIEFNDSANEYNPAIAEAKDQADIEVHGLRSKAVYKFNGITTMARARDVAQLMLQRELHVRNGYKFRLGVRFSLLEPMDLLTLTEPLLGLDRQLVRIVSVEEQDDFVNIEAEEVNVGTASAPTYGTQPGAGTGLDFNVDPGFTRAPLIMNAPGLLTDTGYEIWIAACGLNNDLWGGCVVWVSDDSINFRRAGEISNPARYGELTNTLDANDADLDTDSKFRVWLYQGTLLSGTQEDCEEWRTLCYVGGEWIAYRDAVLISGTTYELDTLSRHGYGSLGEAHLSGSDFARIDDAIFRLPYDKGNIGKTIYFKFTSYNIFGGGAQDIADVPSHGHVIGASELTAPVFGDGGTNVKTLSIVSGKVIVDCATARNFKLSLTANVTQWEFRNVPQGVSISIQITQTGAFTVTPPSSWTSPDNVPYSVSTTVGAVDQILLSTMDYGGTWATQITKGISGGGGGSGNLVVALSPLDASYYDFDYVEGSVTATPSGGTAPYTYSWEKYMGAGTLSGGSTDTCTVGLFAGVKGYKHTTAGVRCTVTDSAGLVTVASTTIDLTAEASGV